MRTLKKRSDFLDRVDFVRRLNAANVHYHGLLRAKQAMEDPQLRNPVAAPSPAAGPAHAAAEARAARDMATLLSPHYYGAFRGHALQPRSVGASVLPRTPRTPRVPKTPKKK
jgi:hypothetical protein